jgi:raffinose/stachyose/melibiose transport system substrate-binding protein
MKRKAIVWVLVTAMLFALSFTAWAGGQAEAEQDKEIQLRWASIWVGQDSKAGPVASLVQEFNAANAGMISVVIDPQPDYNAYDQKVRTALASGTAPADIWTMALNPTTAEFYKSDLLMDFAPVLTPEWKARFDAGSVAQSTIDGKLKTLPYEKAIIPIWYNMDLLAKVGVTDVPKTSAEFWSLMDKLKAAGISATSQMTGDTNA